MPTTVDIPTVGIIEFPDSMTTEDISQESARLYSSHQDAQQRASQLPVLREVMQPARSSEELAAQNTATRKALIDSGIIDPARSGPQVDNYLTEPFLKISNFTSTTPEQWQAVGLGDKASKIAAGAQQAIVQSTDFFTSPLGILTLGLGALPAAAQRTAAAAFAVHMAKDVPEKVQQVGEAWEADDTERLSRVLTDLGLTTAFIGVAGKHALTKPVRPAEIEANAPLTAEALQKTSKESPVTETPPPVTEAPAGEQLAKTGAEAAKPTALEPIADITAQPGGALANAAEAIAGEPLPAEALAEFHAGIPVTQILNAVNNFFTTRGRQAVPQVQIDTTHPLPRLQPWQADKLISSSPEGIATIPGAGKMLDPRASAFTEADRAIIANAKERGVGESVAALWAESNRERVPFVADATGQIELAGGQRGFMSDVIEAEMRNPGSQPITPEQRTWITDVWEPLLNDARDMMRAEGVRDFPDGPYFPRIATGKKNIAAPEKIKTGGSVGGRQFFEHERQYPTEEAGTQTTIYEPDPVKRVATLITRTYKAVADHRLAQDASLGGRDVSLGPPLFQQEGQVFQPAFQGRVFPIETANRLNKHYGESSHDWVRKTAVVNDVLKSAQLAIDISAPFVQGLPILFNKPVAWGRSVGNSLQALFDRNQLQKVLDKPEMKQAANELSQLGVSLAKLQDFMAGSQEGSFTTRLPVIGKAYEATGRSFGVFMDVAKLELWRSFRDVTPQAEWPRMAELVENLAGTSRMETIGLSPGRALGERLLALAPSYYRSAPALVATALQGGATGSKARSSLARFGSGMTMVSVAGMLAAGLSWDEIRERLNPAKGKFLKVPVQVGDKTIEVGFGHLLISVARLAGDTIEDANSGKPAGEGVENEPWKRWLRGHAAPVPSTLVDMTTGRDFSGKEISDTQAILKRLQPIAVQQANEPDATAGQRIADASLSFFGFNAYPQSVREMFRNERNKVARAKFDKDYEDLSMRDQAKIHRELQKDERFTKPPSTSKAREMAFQADTERQQALTEALPKETRERLTKLGLKVTGYDPIVSVGGTKLPLTANQAVRYEALIAEEYNRRLAPRTNWKVLEGLPADRRQKVLTLQLSAAKDRARARLISESNKPAPPAP